jgi:redox-sensing transcriptional repressor
MRYYQLLSECPARGQARTVTSGRIAESLDIDPTQVRKDFAAIGLLGLGRVGFDMDEICRAIQHALGFNHHHGAILVGAGHLGSAILAYQRFTRYGLHFLAAFDSDPRKVGRRIKGCTVRPMRALRPFVRRHGVRLAVVTTPADVAQRVIDRLAAAGVVAIWNFAPTHPTAPAGVLVRNEHISLGLSEITHHLQRQPEVPTRARTAGPHDAGSPGRLRKGRGHVALPSSQS